MNTEIAEAKKKEWERYAVPNYQKNEWHNECRPLLSVYHVAHVETAIRILKDGHCKAGLVFDKSKLNTERILVNWLSPNEWSNGSRYGNIGFEMQFSNLIKNKKYYWVETMTAYNPTAIRILITDKEYVNLTPYDPIGDDGPWKYDEIEEIHYWNAKYCLEFMFEGDIWLNEFAGLKTFTHHDNFCCIDHQTCTDKGLVSYRAGARLIAGIIANNVKVHLPHFGQKIDLSIEANPLVKDALGQIYMQMLALREKVDGDIFHNDAVATTYIQALLNFYLNKDVTSFNTLACCFNSQDDFKSALITAAVKNFNYTSVKNLGWPPS
jgi:hypothetical protein